MIMSVVFWGLCWGLGFRVGFGVLGGLGVLCNSGDLQNYMGICTA